MPTIEPMFFMDALDPQHGDWHPRSRRKENTMADYDLLDLETRGLKVLSDVANMTARRVRDAGVDKERAHKIGLEVAKEFSAKHGGGQLYLPKGTSLEIEERDWQMWEEYDGSNIKQLAKKHKMTERQAYNRIARCRAEWDRKHQLQLFSQG